MAGLIQQQMPAAGPAQPQDGPPPEMSEAALRAGAPMDDEAAEAGPGEDDPVFQQAMTYAYQALYENDAAKDVARQLRAADNLADGMANVAYEITSVIDERTDGQVPDELLVPLAMNVLEEVGEIAQAAKLDPQPEDVALAFKTMILRYLGEQGIDTAQLQQAMDKVDPSEFRRLAGAATAEE